ncbi:MAG TPA: disulfide oxidoreductase [Patescibacteria group bacterium]|nr:disulfide oxidoreductase [Patescibacteria group bacterium]
MLKKFDKKYLFYISWIQAIVAMAGSLYFSEIRKFPPCILCWYQRICMYPLVALIAIGIYKKDKNLPYYVLPLSLIGTAIAVFHNLLYFNIIPESAAPCIAGVSCTTKFIEYFGFITIPFLSLCGFLIIDICMILYLKWGKLKV